MSEKEKNSPYQTRVHLTIVRSLREHVRSEEETIGMCSLIFIYY